MECPFCNIVNNKSERMLRETTHTFTVLSNPRLMQGHLLVIPKKHIERLSELSKEERDELFNEVVNLQEKVLTKIATGCDVSQHFRPFIPNSYLKVGHLHFHVRPRELDDDLFTKVQAFEKDVFEEIKIDEVEKYRKILF